LLANADEILWKSGRNGYRNFAKMVAKIGKRVAKIGRWVAKIGRWVAKIGRWVDKLVARLLITPALWVRTQASLKNIKWAI
jgi:hypothetical protein